MNKQTTEYVYVFAFEYTQVFRYMKLLRRECESQGALPKTSKDALPEIEIINSLESAKLLNEIRNTLYSFQPNN